MISQQDYFPIDFSLQEVIFYPDKLTNDPVLQKEARKKIEALLKEIGLGIFSVSITDAKDENKTKGKDNTIDLDSVKDWHTILSGGEKKKVLIVSAIIKHPDILILDEVFNGLDEDSIITVQQMLRQHLPNALVLVVDHHAQNNNYNDFYDNKLSFIDKTIVLQDFISQIKNNKKY